MFLNGGCYIDRSAASLSIVAKKVSVVFTGRAHTARTFAHISYKYFKEHFSLLQMSVTENLKPTAQLMR
jgi:hypothetical protein